VGGYLFNGSFIHCASSMNQLIEGEASRITAVLDETIFCLNLLDLIPERANMEEMGELLDQRKNRDVVDSVKQLYFAQSKYTAAVKSKLRDKIDTATNALHITVREVVRCLRKDKRAVAILEDWLEKRNYQSRESKENREEEKEESKFDSEMASVVSLIEDYNVEVAKTLAITVEEAQAQTNLFYDTQSRINEYDKEFQALKAELKDEGLKEMELNNKKDTVSKLCSSIRDVQQTCDREMAEIDSYKKHGNEKALSSFTQAKTDAMACYDKACRDFISESQAREDLVESMRKKINRSFNEVNTLIFQYDQDMTKKYVEYEELQRRHHVEKSRLAILEEHFRKVDRDLANEAEEERIIAEEQARLDSIQKRIDDSAARIQALYRGRKARTVLKKKKKGKKGAKKGNKKK